MSAITEAEQVVATHRPTAALPGDCPVCTARGVNPDGTVGWPCGPYTLAARTLREAGVPRPAPADDESRRPARGGINIAVLEDGARDEAGLRPPTP